MWGWKGNDACAQDWAVVHPLTKSALKEKKLDAYAAVGKAEEMVRKKEEVGSGNVRDGWS